MIDITKLPENIVSDMRDSFGLAYKPDSITNLSFTEALDAYLKYQGLIGYAEELIRAYEAIKAAEVKKPYYIYTCERCGLELPEEEYVDCSSCCGVHVTKETR